MIKAILPVRGEPETYQFVDHQGYACEVRVDQTGALCIGPRNNPLKLMPAVADELWMMVQAYASGRPLHEGEKE
jgi:hypothetical protein